MGPDIEMSVSFVLGFGFAMRNVFKCGLRWDLLPHMIPKHAMDLLHSCIWF